MTKGQKSLAVSNKTQFRSLSQKHFWHIWSPREASGGRI